MIKIYGTCLPKSRGSITGKDNQTLCETAIVTDAGFSMYKNHFLKVHVGFATASAMLALLAKGTMGIWPSILCCIISLMNVFLLTYAWRNFSKKGIDIDFKECVAVSNGIFAMQIGTMCMAFATTFFSLIHIV